MPYLINTILKDSIVYRSWLEIPLYPMNVVVNNIDGSVAVLDYARYPKISFWKYFSADGFPYREIKNVLGQNLYLSNSIEWDYIRNNFWIADTGNNRVIKYKNDSIEHVITDLIYPFMVKHDPHNGDYYVFSFVDPINAKVTTYNNNNTKIGEINYEFAYLGEDFNDLTKNPVIFARVHTFDFDINRRQLWWVTQDRVFMLNVVTKSISMTPLRDVDKIYSLKIEQSTGSAFVNVKKDDYSVVVYEISSNNGIIIGWSYLNIGSEETPINFETTISSNLIPFTVSSFSAENKKEDIKFVINDNLVVDMATRDFADNTKTYLQKDLLSSISSIVESRTISESSYGIKHNIAATNSIEYKTIANANITPKFVWRYNLDLGETSGSTSPTKFYSKLWVSTKSNELRYYLIGDKGIENKYVKTLDSTIHSLINEENYIYASTNNYIYSFVKGEYVGGEVVLEANAIIPSNRQTVKHVDYYVWCVSPYTGSVHVKNKRLEDVRVIEGLDSINSICYNEKDNSYIFASNNRLYKYSYSSETVECFYSSQKNIQDISISRHNHICVLFVDEVIVLKNYYDRFYSSSKSYSLVSYLDKKEQFIFWSAEFYDIFDIKNKSIEFKKIEAKLIETKKSNEEPVSGQKIWIIEPFPNDFLIKGSKYIIKWGSSESEKDIIQILLFKNSVELLTVAETDNTGSYEWNIPDSLQDGDDYQIKINRKILTPSTGNESVSSVFSILQTNPMVVNSGKNIVGVYIPYSEDYFCIVYTDKIVYDDFLEQSAINVETQLNNASESHRFLPIKLGKILGAHTKFRIFVGTTPYTSEMWDSKVVEGSHFSSYYSGKKLEPNKKYYWNLQLYFPSFGWTETIITEFTTPEE